MLVVTRVYAVVRAVETLRPEGRPTWSSPCGPEDNPLSQLEILRQVFYRLCPRPLSLFSFFRPLMSFVLFPRNLFCLPRCLSRKMPFCSSLRALAREPQNRNRGSASYMCALRQCCATVLNNPRNNTLFPAFDVPIKLCSACVRSSYRDVLIPNILYEL